MHKISLETALSVSGFAGSVVSEFHSPFSSNAEPKVAERWGILEGKITVIDSHISYSIRMYNLFYCTGN